MMARTAALLDQLITKYECRLGVAGLNMKPQSLIVSDSSCAQVKVDDNIKLEALSTGNNEAKAIEEVKIIEEVKEPAPITEAKHEEEVVDLSKAPYELFSQIDIRVGNIVECWKHPSSSYLYCERIDLAEGKPREIGSGLQESIPIEEMIGKILVMANLKPRKLGGFNSNGMVMALHTETGLALVRPGDVEIGERVGLEGILQPGKSAMLPLLNPKKKVLEKSISFFATDSEGYACFGLKRLLTSAGYIQTNFSNARIS